MDAISKRLQKALLPKNQKTLDPYGTIIAYSFDAEKLSLPDLNQLRRFIFQSYETPAVEAMKITRNTSSTLDAIYLSLFSYLLIDDSEWNGETVDFRGTDYMGSFSITVTGDKMITIEDFQETAETNGLKLVRENNIQAGPIVWLRANEDINMTLYVKRDRSGSHASHYPHRQIYVAPDAEDGMYKVVISSRWMSPDIILEKSLEGMQKKK